MGGVVAVGVLAAGFLSLDDVRMLHLFVGLPTMKPPPLNCAMIPRLVVPVYI